MKNIIITESQYHRLFDTINLLTESDSRLKKLEQVIRQSFQGILNPDDTVSGQEYYVNNNPNTTWLQYIAYSFRHTFGLMSNADVKYIPDLSRIIIGELGFEKEYPNQSGLNFMMRVVQLVKKEPTLFTKYIQGQDFDSIYQSLSPIIEQQDEEENERINNTDFSNSHSDYEIIENADYDTAHKIGNYSSPQGKLCYTQSESTWGNYTHDGKFKCYIFLKNGWRNIPDKHTESLIDVKLDGNRNGSAYDEYGLSMIFVFVDFTGSIMYCNTRWNHDADYAHGASVDHALNKEQISNIVGKDLNKIVKTESLEEMFKKYVKKIFSSDEWDVYQGINDKGVYAMLLLNQFGITDEELPNFKNTYLNVNKTNDRKLLLEIMPSGYFYAEFSDSDNKFENYETRFEEYAKYEFGFDENIYNFYLKLTYVYSTSCSYAGINILTPFLGGLECFYAENIETKQILNSKPFIEYNVILGDNDKALGIKVKRNDGSEGIITSSLGELLPNDVLTIHSDKAKDGKYFIVSLKENGDDFVVDLTTGESFLKEYAYQNKEFYCSFGHCSQNIVRVSIPWEEDDSKDIYNEYDLVNKKWLLPEFSRDYRTRETLNNWMIVKCITDSDKGYNILDINTMQKILPHNFSNYISVPEGGILWAVFNPSINDSENHDVCLITNDQRVFKLISGVIYDDEGNEYEFSKDGKNIIPIQK